MATKNKKRVLRQKTLNLFEDQVKDLIKLEQSTGDNVTILIRKAIDNFIKENK